ncbi:unnamed protein product [Clonostachys rhizophaga]|uniref:Uncharacterized protein n=1 Tax=Clonostachys rhizophaga TaxID=160324 RepID=A0A9N9VBL4_9HYPO|nr:unnamed protein product [Clonostachys rhizophaga]
MPRKPRAATKSKAASTATTTSTATSSPTPQNALLFPDDNAFITWLEANHSTTPQGTWILIAKKNTSPPSITYDQAVDTAICFGWIDGQRKSIPDPGTHFAQRFSPRRPRSMWSARNVAKVDTLAAQGRMKAAGWAEVDAAKEDGRWDKAYAGPATMEAPPDFLAVLEGNEAAREFWGGLGRSARYPFLFRIETAVKAETRVKRIEQFVELLGEEKTL